MEKLKVEDVAKELGWSAMYIREWIAQGDCPFGVSVKLKGSSRRRFLINAEKFNQWKGVNNEGRAEKYNT